VRIFWYPVIEMLKLTSPGVWPLPGKTVPVFGISTALRTASGQGAIDFSGRSNFTIGRPRARRSGFHSDHGSATARQSMTNHEGEFVPGRDSYWVVNVTPAAHEELVEKGAMNAEHYGRRAHGPPRASGNRLNRSGVMAFGEYGEIATHVGKRWVRQHPTRRCREYAVRVQ